MPVGVKAGTVALGGIVGGGVFVGTNYVNSKVQRSFEAPKDSNNNNSSSAYSMIDPEDNVYTIATYLNIDTAICIVMLVCSVLLIYLYYKSSVKSKIIYILWILLMIISLFSVYLAYNLIEDINNISYIYQSNNIDNQIQHISLRYGTIDFLIANLSFRICIPSILYFILALNINTKIINENWEFKYLYIIFGKTYHSYFMKLLRLTSKSNNIWIVILWIMLAISCLLSAATSLYITYNIDLITTIYIYENV